MRRAGLQFIEDCISDALRVAAEMRIPKPQGLDTTRLQKFFSFHVMFPLVRKTVLAAIQLHIEFRLLAKEIKRVNAERVLAAEFIAGETTGAQPAPDEFLRPRFNLAELPGAFDIGHGLRLENSGVPAKLVLTLALTLTLSPGERE